MNRFKKIYCRIFQTCFKFALPFLPYRTPKIINSVKGIPEILEQKKCDRVLIITDAGVYRLGLTKRLEKTLDTNHIAYSLYHDTVANPTTDNVEEALKMYQNDGCSAIIGFGGGSSMDTAKGIGIVTNNPEFADVVSLEGCAPTKHKTVPIIALPTTAGTAAETTINYVIIDEEKHKKMVCVDPNDIPCCAIIDAELMYSLPKGTTAATGMDALTHAIEGYITKAAWELSDMFEIEAIRLINKYLRQAVYDPKNPAGRSGMALAQYVAGMAFSNVGLGVVHGMAHPMGSLFDIPHGVANALLLPTIMEYNKPVCIDKYVEIAKAMDAYKEGMTKAEAAQAACDAVRALAIEVGIPQHLSDLGITAKDIDALADQAIEDVCTPGNPRLVTRQDIVELYKKVL